MKCFRATGVIGPKMDWWSTAWLRVVGGIVCFIAFPWLDEDDIVVVYEYLGEL